MSRTRNTADLVSLNALNASGGRVGIGTTAKTNQLYVEGDTNITGVTTSSGGFVGESITVTKDASVGGALTVTGIVGKSFTNPPLSRWLKYSK